MGVFSGKQWLQNYRSFIKIPAWLIQLSVELNLLKPLYVHNDHLGTFDNSNAR